MFRSSPCRATPWGITLWILFFGRSTALDGQDWKPAEGPLFTRWATEVSPENVHVEYPRPQLKRDVWQNLNGLWDYAIRPREERQPSKFDGKILVPFAIESALSGVKKQVGEANHLWYRRSFAVPSKWRSGRVLLHFGAVDWDTTVFVNGKEVGTHRGGYDPFTFDITDALLTREEQGIVVRVWDPSDKGYQPRGKQVEQPHAIWYTPVTGIWQTVWLEPVPKTYISKIKLTPDLDQGSVTVELDIAGDQDNLEVHATVSDGARTIADISSKVPKFIVGPLSDARAWTPDNPVLYSLKISSPPGDQPTERIDSYFALRKIELRQDRAGVNRLFLNNEPLFHFGPLDQGWWPDGLYTAPTDEALKYDIEITKKLGFNMCRKHVKVEPARWYYWCDKLGLMVWQDMPSGDRYIGGEDPDIERTPESDENFRREYKALIDSHYNHPCIVAWVPFNEGWGQFATNDILAWTRQYDPTRLVDGPSGWTDRGEGDMHDMHRYPGPDMPPLNDRRAAVLGEFGGLGWPVKGHLWQDKDNWGYRTYQSQEALLSAYRDLMVKLAPLAEKGLAAAVYTQTTDVEIEVNGLMTYDREVIKLPFDVVEDHQRVYDAARKSAGQ